MRINDSRDHSLPMQIDNLILILGQVLHRTVCADGGKAAIPDHQGFGPWRLWIAGVDVPMHEECVAGCERGGQRQSQS